jgi:putative N6-adenine-specific DNA methylase
MIARRIAPGLSRSFASETWPQIGRKAWDEARAAARAAILPGGDLKMRGYDIDPERIKDSQANAKKAGVAGDIIFEHKDLKDLWISEPAGDLISNPPYGIKLGSLKELTPIYVMIHHMFKNKLGWALYVITADDRFPDFFKRARPDKVRKLFNGTIEVNYYQYHARRSDAAQVMES